MTASYEARAAGAVRSAAEHYSLLKIEEHGWRPFIQERFEEAGKTIPRGRVAAVCDLTDGHPFCVQHLCHILWERCEEGSAVAEEDVGEAVDILLSRESYAYATLWESLTLNQRRFLRGLTGEAQGEVEPFSADFAQRYELDSPSSAQRAAEALLGRDLIDRGNGSYAVLDRFFRPWIRRM